MNSGTWLVVVQSEPDTDHLLAGISRSASRGQAIAVIVTGYCTPSMQFRINRITSGSNVQVLEAPEFRTRRDLLGKLLRFRHRRQRLVHLLQKFQVSLVIQEWGDGTAGLTRETTVTIRSRFFSDFPRQLQLAAKDLRIPVVALPHGHSLKDGSIGSQHARDVAEGNGGKLPFSNRDSFAAYVVAHESERQFLVQCSDMHGANIQVWGSARFSPAWVKLLYSSCTPFDGGASDFRKRVLFFIPKWNNLIHRQETLEMLQSLGMHSELDLWIRSHPRRSEASLSEKEWKSICSLPAVREIPHYIDTVALIKGCDVLVEIESSIAIDAVIQGKPVVMPRYLQDQSVVLRIDSSDCVLRTYSLDETVRAVLEGHLPSPCNQYFLENVAAQRFEDTSRIYDQNLQLLVLPELNTI